jgi:hypothetical protein
VLLLAKGFYGSLQLSLHCSFLLDLVLHDMGSLHDCTSPGHLFMYQSKALVFLMKACQLIFNDKFYFFHKILLGIF